MLDAQLESLEAVLGEALSTQRLDEGGLVAVGSVEELLG